MPRPYRQSTRVEDRKLRQVIAAVGRPSATFVEVGILKGEIATYAIVHEFGSPRQNIAQRSFMRASFDANRTDYEKAMQRGYERILSGDMHGFKAVLTELGRRAQTDVKRKIRSGPFAPLAPATIARKGSSRPLIDTGTMRNAVVFQLRRAEPTEASDA